MNKEKNTIKAAALTSGAVILSAFGNTNVQAATLLEFEHLGTGADVRTNLITANAVDAIKSNTSIELECGEGKCGEGKCGEGKCGEKSEKKSDDKAAVKPMEAKPQAISPMPTETKSSTENSGMTGVSKEKEAESPKTTPPN